MGRSLGYAAILIAAVAVLMLFPPVARASGARVDAMGDLYGFLGDDEDWFLNPAFLGGVEDKVLDLTYGTGRVDSRKTATSGAGGVINTGETLDGLILWGGDPFDPFGPTPPIFALTIPQSLIFTTVLPFPEKNAAGNTFAVRYARDLFSYAGEKEEKGLPTVNTKSSFEMSRQAITILDGWKANQRLALGFGYTLKPAPLAQAFHAEIADSSGGSATFEETYEDKQALNSYQAGLAYRFDQKNTLDLAVSYDKRSGDYEIIDKIIVNPLPGVSLKTPFSQDFGAGRVRLGFRHDPTENTSVLLALTGSASTTKVESQEKKTILDEKDQALELAGGFRTRTERWTLAGNARVTGQAMETVQKGDIPDLGGMVRTYFNLGGEYRITSALCFRAGVGLDALRDPYQDPAAPPPTPSFQTTLGLGYTIDNFIFDLAVPILLADAQTTKDSLTGLPAEFTSSVRYQARFSISTRF
ncbi:MAG: hypothetical protein M1379_16225 [Firmicutes bacterium]|nr:hypothetical protein [Bacillota bacterium]